MVATINTDCVSINITSPLIEAYLDALPSPDHSLTLSITKNCCDTFPDIELTDANLGVDVYVLTPEDLGTTGTIPDGIYTLKITKTVTDSGSMTSEFVCVFVSCDIECDILDFLVDNPTSVVVMYYEALKLGNICEEIECTSMCTLYDLLLIEMTGSGCGC